MSTSKRDLSQRELLKNLLGSMHDGTASETEMNEQLKTLGYDPSVVVSTGMEALNRLQGKLRLERGRERRQLLDKAKDLLAQLRSTTDPNSIATAMKMVTGGQPQYAGFFSKVKDLSEHDSNQIIDDAELLKILEGLERSDSE
ncbi:MAG TPA: hypothetical protein PKE21_12235 [Flavobacteriales bacterium]|nr:hypothetical protein [Flavobacteriales bacterium]HMR28242.1 hypothetical protein [Flavobacteriales bacterium]